MFCFKVAFAGEALSYTITEKAYRFSTEFEMQSKDRYLGTLVKKNFFQLRTSYELYDPIGNYEAQGICRILSLGAVYVWAKEIDVLSYTIRLLSMSVS